MKQIAMVLGALALVGATPPPRQITPLVKPQCDSAGHVIPSSRIIVQGGIAASPVMGTAIRPESSNSLIAIGPKQDDPGPPPNPDLHVFRIGGTGDPAALGPKQDDPGPPPSPDLQASRVGEAGDPAAIGPKQDDPSPPPNPELQAFGTGCQIRPRG